MLAIAALLSVVASAGAQVESRPAVFVEKVLVTPDRVTEAPEGRSDTNWVVGNLADGRWGTPPFYPNQQWMARHIGEPGYDIWCHLDFGQPRDVCQVRVGDSQLGSFVHLKDIELEFDDGARVPLTMAQHRMPQVLVFPTHRTSSLRIHLLSHYGDGVSIDVNSGGFAEVEVFGLSGGRAERTQTPTFTAARSGYVTTWLVAAGVGEDVSTPRWAVEREVVDAATGRFWEMVVSPTREVAVPGGGLAPLQSPG